MASNLVRWGIPSIALLLAASFVWAVDYTALKAGFDTARRRRQTLVAAVSVAGYLGFIATLALTGVLGRFDLVPPPLALWMASIFGAALGVGLSPLGRRFADQLPFVALVGFQAFRLPLELVMHRAATEKVMPSVMSFGGYNFDIVSGSSALLLAVALAYGHVPRSLLVAWNALGAALLAVIVTIAFLATPLVHAFGDDQVNTWVTQFPYAWMAVMVASALLGHVLLARKLSRARVSANAHASAPRAGSHA
jgi:hypothetical protein